MQIGLLVDELLPFKEIQDGRHNYSFSQLAPQQLTNVIYSKNKKLYQLFLNILKKNHQNRIIFEGVMARAKTHVICQKCGFREKFHEILIFQY